MKIVLEYMGYRNFQEFTNMKKLTHGDYEFKFSDYKCLNVSGLRNGDVFDSGNL